MGLALKAKKAIEDPGRALSYVGRLFSRLIMVRRVKRDGQVFYQYQGELYPEYLNRGNAASYILDKAKVFCRGTGIDVGADEWPFPGSIPVQEAKDQNAYRLDRIPESGLDYVFSSHCLEHLEQWEDALRLWISKLKTGGVLFLYLPHESMRLWRRGSPWVGKLHKWIPTYQVLNRFLVDNGMEITEYEPDKDKYRSFYIAARKLK